MKENMEHDLIDATKKSECVMCGLRGALQDSHGVTVCSVECYERFLGLFENWK